ncbi:MAG TPA: methylamine utilization protein MauJ [Gemmataceae bacterium]|nr:methylamine utilization protein MauJ [Gemmataceae bacterium]
MPSNVKGTLKYTCDVLGLIFRSFDPLEIQTTEHWVEKIVVECRNEKPIELTVTFASAPSADTALISGKVICRMIVGRLALQYGLCIQEPILAAQELVEEKDGRTKKVIAGSFPMVCSGKDNKKIEPQDVAALKADLEDLRPNRQDYEELYRVAMQAVDNVDRYMSLYRILSLLCPNPKGKEKQQYVDLFIEQQTTELRTHARPDMAHIKETIYSKLRNEVGHARHGVDLAHTRHEMDTRVYELAKIARKAIEIKT